MRTAIRAVWTDTRPTAVIVTETTWDLLPLVWPPLLGQVWSFVRDDEGIAPGRNVMVYRDDRPLMEVGVEVAAPIEGNGVVVPSTIPGGRAVLYEHRGAYDGLPAAHEALRHWCDAHALEVTGVRWEVYGDWTDDPDLLSTDVYWQLA